MTQTVEVIWTANTDRRFSIPNVYCVDGANLYLDNEVSKIYLLRGVKIVKVRFFAKQEGKHLNDNSYSLEEVDYTEHMDRLRRGLIKPVERC